MKPDLGLAYPYQILVFMHINNSTNPSEFKDIFMSDYDKFVYARDETIEDVHKWLWIVGDNGAWDGPKLDWINHHRPNILKHVTNFDTVVQAGGCCGMYPRLLSSMFTNVYTFEPDPLSFHCLVNNCQLDKIIKINAGLGSHENMLSVKRNVPSNVGMNTTLIEESSRIPQLMLDHFDFKSCGLLMLDVEGYEPHIIQGALGLIERCRPVIFAENGNEGVLDPIKRFGYTLVAISAADRVYKVTE